MNNKKRQNSQQQHNDSSNDFDLPNYDESYKDFDYKISVSQQQSVNNRNNNNISNSNNNNNNNKPKNHNTIGSIPYTSKVVISLDDIDDGNNKEEDISEESIEISDEMTNNSNIVTDNGFMGTSINYIQQNKHQQQNTPIKYNNFPHPPPPHNNNNTPTKSNIFKSPIKNDRSDQKKKEIIQEQPSFQWDNVEKLQKNNQANNINNNNNITSTSTFQDFRSKLGGSPFKQKLQNNFESNPSPIKSKITPIKSKQPISNQYKDMSDDGDIFKTSNNNNNRLNLSPQFNNFSQQHHQHQQQQQQPPQYQQQHHHQQQQPQYKQPQHQQQQQQPQYQQPQHQQQRPQSKRNFDNITEYKQQEYGNVSSSYDDGIIQSTQSSQSYSLTPTQEEFRYNLNNRNSKNNGGVVIYNNQKYAQQPHQTIAQKLQQSQQKQRQQYQQQQQQQQQVVSIVNNQNNNNSNNNNNGIYPFSKRSNSFKNDKKHFGTMLRDSQQKYQPQQANINDYSSSIEATQRPNAYSNNNNHMDSLSLSSQISGTQPTSTQQQQKLSTPFNLVNMIRGSSHLSIKSFDWDDDKDEINNNNNNNNNTINHDIDINNLMGGNQLSNEDDDEPIEDDNTLISNSNIKTTNKTTPFANPFRNDSIEDIEDNNKNYESVPPSPPPPLFRDRTKRSPNSKRYIYVDEDEIIDNDDNNNYTDNNNNNSISPLKPVITGNIFKIPRPIPDLKDDIVTTDSNIDDFSDDVIFSDDNNIPTTANNNNTNNSNDSQFQNNSKSKNKWLELLSDSIIKNDHANNINMNQASGGNSSIPIMKQLNINKKYERGGLAEKLLKVLTKQKHNYELVSRKNNVATTKLLSSNSGVPNHYKRDLHIRVIQTPSLLQPHVYVCICVCSNWLDTSSFLIPDPNDPSIQIINTDQGTSKQITVLFQMIAAKSELKLTTGSHVIVEYWQNIQSQNSNIILSHISHLDNNSNDSTTATTSTIGPIDEITNVFETIQIENPQNELLKSLKRSNTSIGSGSGISGGVNDEDENLNRIINNCEILELENVTQNSIDINIHVVLFQCFYKNHDQQPIENIKNNVISIYVTNLNGAIAEIQVPLVYIDQWKSILDNDHIFKEVFFTNLIFIENKNINRCSNFGSFLSHYVGVLKNGGEDRLQSQFNQTVFRVSEQSKYFIKSTQNPSFIQLYKPIIPCNVQDAVTLLASSIPTFEDASYFYQRLSVKGKIAYISKQHFSDQQFIVYLIDNFNGDGNGDGEQQQGDHCIGIKIENQFHQLEKLMVGDHLLIQHCIIQLPYQDNTSLLLADEFSIIDHTKEEQVLVVDAGNQIQTFNGGIGIGGDDSRPTKLLKYLIDFKLPNVENLEDPFKLYFQYDCLSNFNGKIIENNSNQFIYRGCCKCQSPVALFPNEYLISNQDGSLDEIEHFFCSKCKSIVESLILVELNLIIQLIDSNGDNGDNSVGGVESTFANLKIASFYCREIFSFPIEYQYAKDYDNQVVGLIGKNIYFTGISSPFKDNGNNNNSEITPLLVVDCISNPIFT